MTREEKRLGILSFAIVFGLLGVPLFGFTFWSVYKQSAVSAPRPKVETTQPIESPSLSSRVSSPRASDVVLAVGGLFIFVAPTVIAVARKHPSVMAIAVVNLLGGLVLCVGWLVALVWSLASTGNNVTIKIDNRVNDG